MARQSLIEFVREYGAHAQQVAVAYRSGYRTERWTYRRIVQEASRFARELESRSIAKGDAVLLWGEPSAQWVAAFLGCVLRGAVVAPIDQISTAEFASRIAREVNAKLLLHSAKLGTPAFTAPSLILESLTEIVARHSSDPYDSPPLSRKDILEIIFTSGTTAEPRGVVISHGNILATLEPLEQEIRRYLRYEKFVHPIRFLNLLPLSHIFGQMLGLFIPPLLAGTVIFVDSFKPSELIETIRRQRVSVFVAVPRLIESLQRELERYFEAVGELENFRKDFAAAQNEHFLWRWWRFRKIHRRFGWKFWAFISGGAALPEAVETFWHRLGYAVIQGYGLTETTSLVSLNHPFRLDKGSIGKTFPGVEMRVNETGEILVRGPNIAASYTRGRDLQPILEQDGWFHTGDLAEVDQSGRLYFKGRRKNVIVTPAGMNVYPEDLESALRKQQGVRDCVVIGLDRNGNAEPCAALLLDHNADGANIINRANQSLAEYQQIRQWFTWPDPDFPRTPTHKPLLPRIREVAQAILAAPGSAQNETSFAEVIAKITGRSFGKVPGSASLETQLNLSSLDRVELMSALESKYQVDLSEVKFAEASTVSQIEQLLHRPQPSVASHAFPRWPQHRLVSLARMAVYYALTWPATYLLAAPRVRGRENLRGIQGPVLVVANHVTYLDMGWILAALPARFRHRLATAMGGERLTGMRHPPHSTNPLKRLLNRLNYFLVVALFNVFPLPKQSGFLKSFRFAGDLVDRGWNVLIFPEGVTTEDGTLAPFHSGIGLLATRINVPILPIKLDGVFELKQGHRKLARPGQVRVSIGKPVRFSVDQDPDEIARDLHRRVAEL